MGEPVKIVDLARADDPPRRAAPRAATSRSNSPALRPGEKLSEELFHPAEPLMPTRSPAIRLAAPRTADYALLARSIDELEEHARAGARNGCFSCSNGWCPNTAAAPPARARSVCVAELIVPAWSGSRGLAAQAIPRQRIDIRAPAFLVLDAELMEIGPRIDPGIVQIVKYDAHGVIADRLEADDPDMSAARNQCLLPGPCPWTSADGLSTRRYSAGSRKSYHRQS